MKCTLKIDTNFAFKSRIKEIFQLNHRLLEMQHMQYWWALICEAHLWDVLG